MRWLMIDGEREQEKNVAWWRKEGVYKAWVGVTFGNWAHLQINPPVCEFDPITPQIRRGAMF